MALGSAERFGQPGVEQCRQRGSPCVLPLYAPVDIPPNCVTMIADGDVGGVADET